MAAIIVRHTAEYFRFHTHFRSSSVPIHPRYSIAKLFRKRFCRLSRANRAKTIRQWPVLNLEDPHGRTIFERYQPTSLFSATRCEYLAVRRARVGAGSEYHLSQTGADALRTRPA
jgi:hypothetical protein